MLPLPLPLLLQRGAAAGGGGPGPGPGGAAGPGRRAPGEAGGGAAPGLICWYSQSFMRSAADLGSAPRGPAGPHQDRGGAEELLAAAAARGARSQGASPSPPRPAPRGLPPQRPLRPGLGWRSGPEARS